MDKYLIRKFRNHLSKSKLLFKLFYPAYSLVKRKSQKLETIVSFDYSKIKNYSKKYLILCPAGIGDCLIICSICLKLFGPEKVHFLIKSSHKIVVSLLGLRNYTIINLDGFNFEELSKNKLSLGNIYVAHSEYNSSFRDLNLYFIQNKISFSELNHLILKDDLNRYNKIKLRDKSFHPLNYPNRIFISPDSNTLKLYKRTFWKNLGLALQNEGFNVVFSSADAYYSKYFENKAPNQESFNLGLESFGCVSFRSGFSDVMAFRNKNLFIIYPNSDSKEKFSLKKLFLEKDFIKEFIYCRNSEKKIISEIIKSLKD